MKSPDRSLDIHFLVFAVFILFYVDTAGGHHENSNERDNEPEPRVNEQRVGIVHAANLQVRRRLAGRCRRHDGRRLEC